MPNPPQVLNFPNRSIQKNIPMEHAMTKEIAKDDVSIELLMAKLEDAGYEANLDAGEISVQRTGCNLKISNFPDHASLKICGAFPLKKEITEHDLDAFIAKISSASYFVNFSAFRWKETGDVGVFGSYVIYYPFGLNLPNFIFSMRRLVEGMQKMYADYSNNSNYFPQEE